jgi:PAS domain S-box-containing protein
MAASEIPVRQDSEAPPDARVSHSRIIGAGEMADLIRGFDWNSTVLGPIETWSDTLVTTVNLLLASRHPMFLWWGPDLIQFYNDGYRPSIRDDKHPKAIGQRGIECWPEIWPIIGPQIEAAMTRGDSSWNTNQLVPINRNGKLEEVFWTYGYSPVRDKDGTVGGTLVVCTETTEHVLSERRLRTLLAITSDSPHRDVLQSLRPIAGLMQPVISKLHINPADIPFAVLFLVDEKDIVLTGNTASAQALANSQAWPIAEVAESQTPRLLESLPPGVDKYVCQPWLEPLSSAYLLPLQLAASPFRAVLVFGISPRLPFDRRYETFLQLIGTRIATLLQEEFHWAERSRASERFRRLTEANPFGTIIGSLQGGITYVNPGFLQVLGYSESDVAAGKVRWDTITPAEYAHADARAIEQLKTLGRCDVYEKAFIMANGRRIPILIGAATLDSSSDTEVAAFVTDLTPLRTAEDALRKANDELEKKVVERTSKLEAEILERERAETNLRQLTGRLLRTQDEERRHMARELHDHAGQTLAALSLNLAALQEAAGDRVPEVTAMAAESQQLSNDLSKEIRTLSYLLHPPLLDEAGLASALRWYVTGFSERSKIHVDLVLPEPMGRLPRELELVVFRVVQEGLTNIHRHSGSSSAKICMTCTNEILELEISDRGKGIPAERQQDLIAARVGVGVRGMQERVRQFKGDLNIISGNQGTKVIVTIPIATDQVQ